MANVQIPDQNVLLLDIETRPTTAYVWEAFDQTIHPPQIIETGGVICVGAKWLGKKDTLLFSDWEHGHEDMLLAIHEMMSHADSIVTFNGDKFDIPKLYGEFLLNGLPPVPPCTSIDVYKTIRKLKFFRTKLGYVGPLLGLGGKLEHEGFSLWTKVINGDERAQNRMAKYCVQDVLLLEKLYLRVRPFIVNHPHLGRTGANQCGACGSIHTQSRGTRRTRAYKIQRMHCQDCGSWFDGKRTKI